MNWESNIRRAGLLALAVVLLCGAALAQADQQATITLYRPKRVHSSAINKIRLLLDDRDLGKFGAQSYSVLPLAAGRHVVRSDHSVETVVIQAEPGAQYFVRAWRDGHTIHVAKVDPDSAREEMRQSQCREMKK